MRINNKKLTNIAISGFKSISNEGQSIPINDITILLGANGAGKSNFISFLQMVNYMTTGALQTYIGQSGTSDALLHFGSKKTARITAELTFKNNISTDKYAFNLAHAAGDTLIFTEETLQWKSGKRKEPYTITLDPGKKESGLYHYMKQSKTKIPGVIYSLIKDCQVFQFHDTSKESRIRNSCYINDGDFLRSDAGNLAAFLYSIKNQTDGEKYYNRIERYISMAMPQFSHFEIFPSKRNENYVMLNWMDKSSDYLFGPHQISDGSLRFMALTTLLMQPPETLPSVIILDEPELGLHPYAISLLAGMVKQASKNCQVIIATQSTRLIDEFEAQDIVVVERDDNKNCSVFKQLHNDQLSEWLENYSLSEMWEKNIFGGRP